MVLFKRPQVKSGKIEGPLRLNVEGNGKSCYTVANFEVSGETMEFRGESVRDATSEPIPPPFTTNDSAIVAVRAEGDGVFKVMAMNVPQRGFTYVYKGDSYQAGMLFISLLVLYLMVDSLHIIRYAADSLLIVAGLISAIVLGFILFASLKRGAVQRLVQQTAR